MGLFGSIDSWARPRHSRAGIFATLLLALAAYPLLTAGANGPSLDGPARADWEHGIAPMTALRYSVTFRTLR